MARRTSSGLVPLIIAAGAVIVFGSQLLDGVQDLLPDFGGRSDAEYAVAPGIRPRTDKCTADQILNDRKCDNIKVVQIDATKMPFIARNIQLAWSEGKPFILHKDAPGTDEPKRNAACGRFKAQFPKGSCDEFVFASSQEGGRPENVRIEEVPLREQNCQGGTLRQEYRRAQITEGDAFTVVITNPDRIADRPYWGVDIAKEQACGS